MRLRAEEKRSAGSLWQRYVIDDPLAVGVDAKGDERPVANDPESVHTSPARRS